MRFIQSFQRYRMVNSQAWEESFPVCMAKRVSSKYVVSTLALHVPAAQILLVQREAGVGNESRLAPHRSLPHLISAQILLVQRKPVSVMNPVWLRIEVYLISSSIVTTNRRSALKSEAQKFTKVTKPINVVRLASSQRR